MLDRRIVLAGGLAAGASWPARAVKRGVSGDLVDAAKPAGFSGVVLVARGGRTELTRVYGFANIEQRALITDATRFALGSGSKWLTTVAVLRLVDSGRLDLDRPLLAYLPSFRADTGSRVTLRHLLSNTSGIPDLLSRALGSDPRLRTATDAASAMVARFGGGDLSFAPGTNFDYAALNWVIVTAIVEQVTARPFADAMSDLVFRPLGLRSVSLANQGWAAVPGMAIGYGSVTPPVQKMAAVPAFAAASGNMTATAHDAMRAMHGVFGTRFLTPRSRAALTEIRWAAEEYALGGRVHTIGDDRWAWETGKVAGYRAHLAHRLGKDETIVVFNNTDLAQPALSKLVERIAAGI